MKPEIIIWTVPKRGNAAPMLVVEIRTGKAYRYIPARQSADGVKWYTPQMAIPNATDAFSWRKGSSGFLAHENLDVFVREVADAALRIGYA